LTVLGKDYVFIHVYKTGGMSMRSLLTDGEYILSGHATALEAKAYIRDRWSELFSFGFVRNPFTWMVSLFQFVLRVKDHHSHDTVVGQTFVEFLGFVQDRIRHGKDYYTLSGALCDNHGVPLVGRVGRFERFEQDVLEICQRIGVHKEIPHLNAGSYDDISHYYKNPRAKSLVLETFARDFEIFGYETAPPA
jgi:hypothetical protein